MEDLGAADGVPLLLPPLPAAPAALSIGEWRHESSLALWDDNPRDNDGEPVERVAASIVRFGFVAPVVIWPSRNRMVAGHTRLKATRWLLAQDETVAADGAITSGPAFVARGAPFIGAVPVRFHEFASEHEAELYAIADNKLGELATWNDEKLDAIVARTEEEDLRVIGLDDRIPVRDDPPDPPPAPSDVGHAVTRILGSWNILQGDALELLRALPDDYFDALLSDPPYGLSNGKTITWDDVIEMEKRGEKRSGGFMGKIWDVAVPGPTFWKEIFRVLKPGAPLLVFGGTRTYHRVACAMEDAGLELRDCISWLYFSGFPKSHDVSKAIDRENGDERPVVGTRPGLAGSGFGNVGHGLRSAPDAVEVTSAASAAWTGYGTALAPAWEPCILARKPLVGTVAANALAHGVGGINIDGTRIEYASDDDKAAAAAAQRAGQDQTQRSVYGKFENGAAFASLPNYFAKQHLGRWPKNVVLDPGAAAMLDAQSGDRPGMSGGGTGARDASMFGVGGVTKPETIRGDNGGASRFVYVAKPSRREREAGLREAVVGSMQGGGTDATDDVSVRFTKSARNVHPTVKPVSLARYLGTLLLPPAREGDARKILIPFSGSGSEMIGALLAGWDDVTGIEREAEYVEIARARVGFAVANPREFEVRDEEPEADADATEIEE